MATTKTNNQPKLFSIYKYSNAGWVHSSYKLAHSRAQLLTLYPQYNNIFQYLICVAR